MNNRWKIGNISFHNKEDYKAGQRDLERIRAIAHDVNLNNRREAQELYQILKAQPFLFETELGIAFRSYLLDKSEGESLSNGLFSEELLKGSKKVHTAAVKKTGRSADIKKRKRRMVILGIAASLGVMLFSLYKIFSYDILSYISERKMEELSTSILSPIEGEVSQEHRIADLVASGLYTKEEAAVKVGQEVAEAENVTEEESGVLYKYSVLFKRNSELAGWIQIADTIVNYPVMLTPDDEEYYLKRGFDKKSDINGIPFMDVRCSVAEPTTNFLIYGHNMKNGSMFSTLLKYEQEEFYKEHPIIRFDTIYETGQYEIVGVFRTQVAFQGEQAYRYYEFIQADSKKEYDEYIAFVKEQSFYETGVTAEYGTQLITLSTCDRSIEEGRLVVVGRKCEKND